jgi:hypothetical protein
VEVLAEVLDTMAACLVDGRYVGNCTVVGANRVLSGRLFALLSIGKLIFLIESPLDVNGFVG